MLPLNQLLLTVCPLFLFPVGSDAQANRFDIIITELLPDPSPSVGLPNSEFIELKNSSSTAFSLRNWKLSDGSNTATINNDFILQPGAYIIICPNAAITDFAVYGEVVGVTNFPSLNNDRDLIILYSPEGKIIHAVEYAADHYQNDIKKDGGWSLEMIDIGNPCGGINNWKASTDASGGTPGKKNSIDGINPDDLPPALLRTYTIDSTTIVGVFDESLDSNSASPIINYELIGIGKPISSSPAPPLFNEVILKFASKLSIESVYQLTVSNIDDCAGNTIGVKNNAPAGLPSSSSHFDIVINEILFNPVSGGYDYIELYNRSGKIVDLQKMYACNKNPSGSLTNIVALATKPTLFFPGTYYVVSENIDWLQKNYTLKDRGQCIQPPSLPSMPDDKSHIAITNLQGEVIDELQYDEKWHFALLENNEGVSLERINYNDSTQNKNNWASAAATAGSGTPGYQNSQFRADLFAQGTVTVFPKLFSPGNDLTTIQCQLTEPGYVANITVFDDKGRPIRYLVKNATMGISGSFRWDGLDEQQKKLPAGQYIILTEIFNLQGKTKKFKNVVVIARNL